MEDQRVRVNTNVVVKGNSPPVMQIEQAGDGGWVCLSMGSASIWFDSPIGFISFVNALMKEVATLAKQE